MTDNTDGQHRTGSCAVAVVGGGTAGLALATELKQQGIDDVMVIEREASAGGVPRHCGHYPFGVTEFKRLLKGPAYAQRLIDKARDANVSLLTGTSVTALHPAGLMSLCDEDGQYQLQAQRVILCTGTREATRAQRFLSGQRPQGVLPTGALQSMVYLHQQRPFLRPVILGTELVSLSAIMTCRHLGIQPVAMLEENSRLIAPGYMRAYPLMRGVPLHLAVSDIHIEGRQAVEAVHFTDAHGKHRTLPTDGVIVSGQFQPESALLRNSHLDICPHTGGPMVDQFYRSSDPFYFCTGNLLRPVETSAWCWQEGRQTARIIADELQADKAPLPQKSIKLVLGHPDLKYVLPQTLSLSNCRHAMQKIQLRLNAPVDGKLVFKVRDEQVLWSGKLKQVPERRILAPLQPLADYARHADHGDRITLSIESH